MICQYYIRKNNKKGGDILNSKQIFNFAFDTFIVLVVLWLVREFLFPGSGASMSFSGNYGGEHMYSGATYGLSGTFTVLLSSLIKLLSTFFVVGLVVGLIFIVKDIIFTKEIKQTFTGAKKEKCSMCGKELNDKWKVCPHCGKEK